MGTEMMTYTTEETMNMYETYASLKPKGTAYLGQE